jgi:hypothetical protein
MFPNQEARHADLQSQLVVWMRAILVNKVVPEPANGA